MLFSQNWWGYGPLTKYEDSFASKIYAETLAYGSLPFLLDTSCVEGAVAAIRHGR